MQTIFIVLLCLIPVFALILVASGGAKKRHRRHRDAPPPPPPHEAPPPHGGPMEDRERHEKKTAEVAQEDGEVNLPPAQDFSKEDFKGYLKAKKAKISAPEKKSVDENAVFENLASYKRRTGIKPRAKEPQERDIITEITTLSPTLQAMLLAGVFDPKF